MKINYYFIIVMFSLSFFSFYFLEIVFAIENEEKILDHYQEGITIKEYVDPKYNFTIMYPYESDRNTAQISVDKAYQVAFSLPLVKPYDNIPPIVLIQISDLNELKNQYQKYGIEKEIDEIARDFHPDDTAKHIVLNYNLINSSFVQLDKYFFSVYEISYISPMQGAKIIEKDVQSSIGDIFIKIVLLSDPSDYHLYERIYDNMIKTFKINNDNETIEYLDKALAIDPNHTEALNNKGWALNGLGNYDKAIEYLDKALAIDPNHVNALNNKGVALDNLGKSEEAITWYDKALAIDPNFKLALTNKGYVLADLGKYEEAITWYDKALAIDPNYLDALNGKGYVLDDMGKYEEAITWYDKALAIDPNYLDALNNKGYAIDNLGKYEEAITWYDKALDIDPNFKLALDNKKEALSKLND